MNGVHDMGGMHGFGPIPREENEPVFHAPWEGRIFGMLQALGPHRVHDPHGMRSALESIDPAQYLSASYYERWLLVTEKALVEKGFLSRAELDAKIEHFRRQPETTPPERLDQALRDRMQRTVYRRRSSHKETGVTPRYKVGDPVTVLNVNPPGHTRLPRYVRGKRGVIARLHGIHDFQDTPPQGEDASPQPVYNVRFSAQELWGETAGARDSLYIDIWESRLGAA